MLQNYKYSEDAAVKRLRHIQGLLSKPLQYFCGYPIFCLETSPFKHSFYINTDPSSGKFVRKSSNTKCYYTNVISFIPSHWQEQEFDWIFPSSLVPYKVYRPKNSWFPCYKGLNHFCLPTLYGGIRKAIWITSSHGNNHTASLNRHFLEAYLDYRTRKWHFETWLAHSSPVRCTL